MCKLAYNNTHKSRAIPYVRVDDSHSTFVVMLARQDGQVILDGSGPTAIADKKENQRKSNQ